MVPINYLGMRMGLSLRGAPEDRGLRIDFKELASVLVEVKRKGYAGGGQEIPQDEVQRPGFKEIVVEARRGKRRYEYRDSYAGFFSAPGDEVVRMGGFKIPIWFMSYSGGMTYEFMGDVEFAKEAFAFLKQALQLVEESRPFRGPEILTGSGTFRDWHYENASEGSLTNFRGEERIYHMDLLAFEQTYHGGLVVPKRFK